MTDTNWNEHYIKRNDPSKPTYYIIRRQYATTGLFGRYNMVIGHIKYALSNGWIPVVDMQNYPNPYLSPDKLGKENSWEYFFEQPFRIGLEQAYIGENVILSTGKHVPFPDSKMSFFENRDGILTEWRTFVKMNLLKIKSERMQEILTVRNELFKTNDRVLGVLLRGTDYVDKKPKGHPIPPPIEFAISTIIVKMEEWHCNKVFLATEDKSIVNIFKEIFGDLCLTLNREYVDYKTGQAITLCRIDSENDYFLQGKDYLTQMALLSTCDSFVAARCSGSVAVMLMTKGFEHTYFFNLGRYGIISLE